jgi:hypothetical protein
MMTRVFRVAAAIVACGLIAPWPAGAAGHRSHPRVRSWFVRAGAPGRGSGSRRAPFATLAAVQRASRAGDRIVILPARLSVPPLNGGITLKRRQVLVGAGRSVLRGGGSARPRIENTSPASQGGDAVRLADHTTVENLVIGPAARGGIYGADVSGVRILGNDLSATNTSCTTGFVVAPFELPTLAPGVGAPFSTGLANGWAAVMVDATHTSDRLTVVGNYVHDGACADGIDVRAMGASRVSARITGNRVTRLREGASQQSVLAIGLQTLGTATLRAQVIGNTETYIGNAILNGEGIADSEGLFANSAGRSTLVEHAADNTFAHGLGHLSANCFEAAASNGGPTMEISFEHSTCQDVVGDILEADNLSRNATMSFHVDHVVAEHTTFVGAPAFHQVEPGDDGDCMLIVASGAASTTDVRIAHSVFGDCVADGVGVVSNVVDGTGPVRSLHFDLQDSRITGNQQSNLRVAWATPITDLAGKVQRTDLAGSGGTPIVLEGLDTSGATRARLDFGGGSLGSVGQNCIDAGTPLDAEVIRATASARDDWWGRPEGPGVGQIAAVGGGLDSASPLPRAPIPGC